MQMKWNQHTLYITNEDHACSDDVFSSLFISKKTRYFCYQEKRVFLNHELLHQNTSLKKGDVLAIIVHEEVEEHPSYTARFEKIDILYEDDLLLIVNKPPYMLVHSDGVSSDTTLYDLVYAYYLTNNIQTSVRAIHRLDKETSGAVIFCKISLLQPLLDHMLMEKTIRRTYYALCTGILKKEKQSIHGAIGKDRHHPSRMRISSGGKEATTDVRIIKRYKDYTLVECSLHQGRTHQIRVHLSSINHPLLHDTLYGDNSKYIERIALHAKKIVLFHPLTKKTLTVECPLPEDISSLLK